ncbi:TIGR02679 family protein [Herbidospora mongoliensis]|uniref:TIGR02679 family protein n=1 Tax=Herbidospora mongoliensis TaxID=688067 RepID=UPI00083535BE|nr:TIGR02679 family protein [Herbidospora mongoliensis]
MTEERLRRLIGGEPLAWLVERVRQRIAKDAPLTGTVTLSAPTPEQRRALAALLGRRPATGSSLTVNLRDVDELLRTTGHGGLAAAVTALNGPIPSLPDARRRAGDAWTAAYRPLEDAVASRPELASWRAWLDSTGLPRRLAPDPADAAVLLSGFAAVLGRLPSPSIPLGRLAAETCGDAHALDEGRPLATLTLSAIRALTGRPFAGETSAESRRATWASAGVHLDELSNTVLTLGLVADPATPLGAVLSGHKDAGEPACLTLRQLRRHPVPIKATRVHLCENPVVVAAAADDLGPDCPPLVCVGGQPSAAVWHLLSLLRAGGATLLYHGDFDWGGVEIATSLHTRVGFLPWRYTAADYLAAPASRPLSGRSRPTPWDPSLSAAMINRAVRVEEELLLDALLTDLSAG